jgi:nucleoside-diphosphate-sugar epimerase
VYGDQDRLPLVEDMTLNPMSPYALHKLISEQYCRLYHNLYGLETVSLRYFNVYGPRQNPEGNYACLIPKFIALISRGDVPVIYGDGEQTRDFTYVSDVVHANLLAATATNSVCFGEAFNVGAGNGLSVNEVTATIAKLVGKDIVSEHGPAVIEPKHTMADIKKSQELLSWQPSVEFVTGLEKTYEYF